MSLEGRLAVDRLRSEIGKSLKVATVSGSANRGTGMPGNCKKLITTELIISREYITSIRWQKPLKLDWKSAKCGQGSEMCQDWSRLDWVQLYWGQS